MTKYAAIYERDLWSGLCISSGAHWCRSKFCPCLYTKEIKELTYPFSGVSIALASDCKGHVLIRVSVPQGLISEASWVHLSFISDMVLMCVCSNLTLELSAAVFSSCLAAILEVERRCGSDTTQLHYKQAYILLVARLISPLFHPQRIRTELTLRLFVLNYWYSKHISSRFYSKLLYKAKSRAFFIPLDALSLGEYFSVLR